MGELIAYLLELIAEIGLCIQEFFFRKKKKKRRAYEKENNLPKKRMISLNQRVYILFAAVVFILFITTIIFFPSSSNKELTLKKITEIKELLEKEKEVFGKYPKALEIIIRNNPLRENLLKDGWSNSFKYEVKEDGTDYFLVSSGRDEEFMTEDDIIITNN